MRRMTRLERMMKDSITFMHTDGSKNENVPATVQKEMVLTFNVSIPLSVGDRMVRTLPNGQTEEYIVTNFHLATGLRNIPDSYQIEYERQDVKQAPEQPTNFTVNVTDSPQARVNLGSADHSTNIINSQANDVFAEIRELLKETVNDSLELDQLLKRVDEMESGRDNGNFTQAYKDFIAAAAAHMTVLAPMLPALTAFLTPAGG